MAAGSVTVAGDGMLALAQYRGPALLIATVVVWPALAGVLVWLRRRSGGRPWVPAAWVAGVAAVVAGVALVAAAVLTRTGGTAEAMTGLGASIAGGLVLLGSVLTVLVALAVRRWGSDGVSPTRDRTRGRSGDDPRRAR